jgi:hypothetical protein
MNPPEPWQPRAIERVWFSLDTSMATTFVRTDAGDAYLKAMGNRQGPHPLACEWVATQLARWFGLPTFDAAVIVLPADGIPIPFVRGGRAAPGPAFITRAVAGETWGSGAAELDQLDNPDDITRLVVFDTWVLNCDRHPPDLATRRPNCDNVFFSTEGTASGRRRLVAMDHSHCFTCGRDLTPRMADIDRERDERWYGLFPEFLPWLRRGILEACRQRLHELDASFVRALLNAVPREWEVPASALAAWEALICRRAVFVANVMIDRLLAQCP